MIHGIAALVVAHGMQGYYCTNNGTKLGEMQVYDEGVVIERILVPSDSQTASVFGEPLLTDKPDFKIDKGTKCYLLVPLN